MTDRRSALLFPPYAFQYVFTHLKPFKKRFVFLTAFSVGGACAHFFSVLVVSRLISELPQLSGAEVVSFYLPLFLVTLISYELLDFFTRRFAESFPTEYTDYTTIRIYREILEQARPDRLFNVSKEKLLSALGRYLSDIENFLGDWFWGLSRKVVSLLLVAVVLYVQDARVFWLTVVFLGFFLSVSFRISRRFSIPAQMLSEKSVEAGTLLTNTVFNLATIQRLAASEFISERLLEKYRERWVALSRVKTFHAFRWLLQLNLFNFLYAGVLFYGAYQVTQGELRLGYLVLIRYAFDRLWDICVYAIEYYVSMVQQEQDANRANAELSSLLMMRRLAQPYVTDWKSYELRDAQVDFQSDGGEAKTIKLPALRIERGQKLGIMGPSGSGKSSLLHALLGLVPMKGIELLDGKFKSKRLSMTLVTNYDPLFKLSVRDNLLLGRNVSETQWAAVVRGLDIESFLPSPDMVIGSVDVNFSAGQEQRLRIARGLFSDADVFLFDEPFNGVDRDLKRRIQDFMSHYLASKTCIIVSHIEEDLRGLSTIIRMSPSD